MNIIEYYSISDSYDDGSLPDPLKLNYSTKEKAIEAAINNYKPRFAVNEIYNKIRFDGVYQNYNSTFYKFSEGINNKHAGSY
jgi:hypothetical protein